VASADVFGNELKPTYRPSTDPPDFRPEADTLRFQRMHRRQKSHRNAVSSDRVSVISV